LPVVPREKEFREAFAWVREKKSPSLFIIKKDDQKRAEVGGCISANQGESAWLRGSRNYWKRKKKKGYPAD